MTSPALTDERPKQTRVRASENALRIALTVAQECGLSVDGLLIEGGKIEIKFSGVEEKTSLKNHGGLEDW